MKKFLAMTGDPDEPLLFTQEELAEGNPYEPELLDWMGRAVIGEVFFGGGGAAAEYIVTRVRDNYARG